MKYISAIKRTFACVLLACLLSIGGLCAPRAAAQSQEPDLQTYTATMREALAAAQRNDRFGVQQAGEQLVATTRVRLPDGTSLPVDNSWLRDEISKSEPDFTLLSDRLGAIVDALAQPASSAPADARERLEQILNNPPFKQNEPEQQQSWISAFFEWLGRLLERLVRPVGNVAEANGSLIGWAVAIVGGLLLAGVIGYLLLGLRRNIVRDASLASADPEANLTAKTAFDQASVLARGGDYRAAVRYLYLAALLRLDERELLRYDRALTNREYLEQTRDNPALQARLAPVVETFDRVWYGHASLDAASFAAYREQVEALRE